MDQSVPISNTENNNLNILDDRPIGGGAKMVIDEYPPDYQPNEDNNKEDAPLPFRLKSK